MNLVVFAVVTFLVSQMSVMAHEPSNANQHPAANACPETKDSYGKWNVVMRDGRKIEVAPYLDGKLSPFWAQEYVGSDLARDFLRKRGDLKEVRIGILDQGDSLEIEPELIAEGAIVAQSKSGMSKVDHGRNS